MGKRAAKLEAMNDDDGDDDGDIDDDEVEKRKRKRTPNQSSNTNEWGCIATTIIQITFDTQCDPLITHHNIYREHTHARTISLSAIIQMPCQARKCFNRMHTYS